MEKNKCLFFNINLYLKFSVILIVVVFNWGEVVKLCWFFVIRGVVEFLFWGWYFYGVRFGVIKLF